MLNNQIIGSHFHHIDFNVHKQPHIFRAVQEGIAFAFRYGLDILRENGMNPSIIRAGKSNLFLSNVFTEAFVNACNIPIEFYETNGSVGAALGAGIGSKLFSSEKEAFINMKPISIVEPSQAATYDSFYQDWKQLLENHLRK
jgi:xylulokinase